MIGQLGSASSHEQQKRQAYAQRIPSQTMDAANAHAGQVNPSVPMTEQIAKQIAVLHQIINELSARTGALADKLGYCMNDACEKAQEQPSRPGVLGQISDALDATEPALRRIGAHLDYVARQV